MSQTKTKEIVLEKDNVNWLKFKKYKELLSQRDELNEEIEELKKELLGLYLNSKINVDDESFNFYVYVLETLRTNKEDYDWNRIIDDYQIKNLGDYKINSNHKTIKMIKFKHKKRG